MIEALHAYTILQQKYGEDKFNKEHVNDKEMSLIHDALDIWSCEQYQMKIPFAWESITNPPLNFEPSIFNHPYMHLLLTGPSGIGKTATVCAYLAHIQNMNHGDKIQYTKMHYILELIQKNISLTDQFKGKRLLVIDNFDLKHLDNETFANFIDDLADHYINPLVNDCLPHVWLIGEMSEKDKNDLALKKKHIYVQINTFFFKYHYTLKPNDKTPILSKIEPLIIKQAKTLYAKGINTPILQQCLDISTQADEDMEQEAEE